MLSNLSNYARNKLIIFLSSSCAGEVAVTVSTRLIMRRLGIGLGLTLGLVLDYSIFGGLHYIW